MNSKQHCLFAATILCALCAVALSPPAKAEATLHKDGVFRLVPAMAPPGTTMKPDQTNSARWDRAWTNLVNDAEQSFIPSLPRLLAVEVNLVVGNPGPTEDELTLDVLDAEGKTVASVTQTVYTADCDHVTFAMSKEGIDVVPGTTYWLKLTGGNTFGWKYVVGGYEKGAATFNGKPLLPKARSTFLFRTFGSD